MKYIDNLKQYAIIMIHPDGVIEKIKTDKRIFHMQYIVDLINKSEKLTKIVNDIGHYLPTDDAKAKLTLSYETDTKLAKAGIIIFHNVIFDPTDKEEFMEDDRGFYVSMPEELSDNQKLILADIFDNYDMSSSWFAQILDNELNDVEYEDIQNVITNRKK